MEQSRTEPHQAEVAQAHQATTAASPTSNPEREASTQEGPSKASPVHTGGDTAAGAQSAEPDFNAPSELRNPYKKQRRKDKLTLEGSEHQELCWSLKRKFAALSQEVEALSQEVGTFQLHFACFQPKAAVVCGLQPQVGRVRKEADLSSAAPELTDEEKALLAERHVKRLAEVQKRGISVLLRDIMGHKVQFQFPR